MARNKVSAVKPAHCAPEHDIVLPGDINACRLARGRLCKVSNKLGAEGSKQRRVCQHLLRHSAEPVEQHDAIEHPRCSEMCCSP